MGNAEIIRLIEEYTSNLSMMTQCLDAHNSSLLTLQQQIEYLGQQVRVVRDDAGRQELFNRFANDLLDYSTTLTIYISTLYSSSRKIAHQSMISALNQKDSYTKEDVHSFYETLRGSLFIMSFTLDSIKNMRNAMNTLRNVVASTPSITDAFDRATNITVSNVDSFIDELNYTQSGMQSMVEILES